MSFQNLLDDLKEKTGELKTEVLKCKNRNFLNAAMAGSALVSMADGSISPVEKQKMLRFVENHEALSIFSTQEVIESFHDFLAQFEFDKDVGEANAYEALRKMKHNDIAARLLMRLIISIAASDGNFDEKEKRVARKIARELGLALDEFELA